MARRLVQLPEGVFEKDSRLVYIETILVEDDPEDSTIHVVSIHDA